MLWYKHFSDALNDPFIQELMDEFSHSGYVAWFGLLEIISKENGNLLTGKLDVKPQYLKRKLRISVAKLEQIYKFCSGKVEEKSEKSQRKVKLLFDNSKENWFFDCPKLLELKDNYTKDLQASNKKPSDHKEAEEEEDTEEEVEKEDEPQNDTADEEIYITKKKRKLKGKRLETFLKFWEIFNYKKSKAEAADSWIDIPELTNNLVNVIYKAALIESKNRENSIINGHTPKMAQGWLSSKRWEDETVLPIVKNTINSEKTLTEIAADMKNGTSKPFDFELTDYQEVPE